VEEEEAVGSGEESDEGKTEKCILAGTELWTQVQTNGRADDVKPWIKIHNSCKHVKMTRL
jgi:hypothetical protein